MQIWACGVAYDLSIKNKYYRMKKILFGLGLFLVVILGACTSNNDNKTNVQFALTDAPSLKGYQALYLDIQGIQYNVGDSNWVSLPISPSVVNIMDFTNGKDTLLSNIELEAGQKISQVRLILGDNNKLVLKDGSNVNVKVPSGQTSGLKINIQSDSVTSSGYKVMIDFNAEKSIVAKGNGSYSLKPVIRGYIVANTSKVFGYISPANVPYKVFTIMNGDTLTTVSDTLQQNYFMLHGLTSGSYDIKFVNAKDSICKTITQSVRGGTDVNMGTIIIGQ